jgi:hypothetical protein
LAVSRAMLTVKATIDARTPDWLACLQSGSADRGDAIT